MDQPPALGLKLRNTSSRSNQASTWAKIEHSVSRTMRVVITCDITPLLYCRRINASLLAGRMKRQSYANKQGDPVVLFYCTRHRSSTDFRGFTPPLSSETGTRWRFRCIV